MRSSDRLRQPFGALLAREVRAVGRALSRELTIATALLAGFCILTAATAIRFEERLSLDEGFQYPALVVALLLPWAVWKGNPPFGHAVLWTLPVRHQNAALAKIAAGALWLVLAMVVALASLSLMALATGGSLGIQEVRLVAGPSGSLAGAAETRWATPLWMWFVPFGGALLAYLISSAALLGLHHPVRWVAGAAVAVALIVVLVVNLGHDSHVGQLAHRTFMSSWGGTFGLDFVLSGGSAALQEDVVRPGVGYVDLWSALPSAGRWSTALLAWLGAASLAVALALRRHWER
jgi:hypothetical protein